MGFLVTSGKKKKAIKLSKNKKAIKLSKKKKAKKFMVLLNIKWSLSARSMKPTLRLSMIGER
jgi:hypothetical protein